MAHVKYTQEIKKLWLARCVCLENDIYAFRVDTYGFKARTAYGTSSQQMLTYGGCWICRSGTMLHHLMSSTVNGRGHWVEPQTTHYEIVRMCSWYNFLSSHRSTRQVIVT